MAPKPHKTTIPLIVRADDDAHTLTPRTTLHADYQCLLVIYPNQTLRQARAQLWMSTKMFAAALGRCLKSYFRKVDRGHETAYRPYTIESLTDNNHRSPHNGNA